ncbi:MAG TPA: ATP-binding protein [Puia sp.]|nr:ATP-binding protein [Puia sp.]
MMFESYQICPYTGLRSFTEEESLYFKGREDDIARATEQLQRNKFLMLTGASGDGKSSLIYAGIIPSARSGFLRSKYSSWSVADFRPERSPFQNLCRVIARELEINNEETVAAELNHGFSALVDLYKNSKKYYESVPENRREANDSDQAITRRRASNLLVLVDQFEEFFTNPENYKNGVPSKESNLVLNILLETARIALDDDLPIYVVFTMRSDYIGQCAAFRGLPEFIGFSQFFVPRLNRTQLQQVIEEPATLSGNSITRRLTERLIHDITEGTDQLPILQHALSQIWVAADSGREEMDLLHYAMVGGMPPNELPDDHVSRFTKWFGSLPPEIQAYYHSPSLQNVLDTHTNKLYGGAASYYMAKMGKTLSAEGAKLIIRNAFSCLTKIDESRAVRNRMSLEEISNILGQPEFDSTIVGEVLNAFREPGNTFIRPFIIVENPESQKIKPGQVLDITHESLIRNWRHLGQWAKEEFESYSVFLDFERQLDRWVRSRKSNSFLLSIGPLTYFETWYKKASPNEWWIARYLPGNMDKQRKLEQARIILHNTREFLSSSARKHAVARAIIRYGTKRIALTLGFLALIVLTSFVAKDYLRKQNSNILNSIHNQMLGLAANPKVDLGTNCLLICEELKLGSTTIDELDRNITDTGQKIDILTNVATQLIIQGQNEPHLLIFESLRKVDTILQMRKVPSNNPDLLSRELAQINNFRVALEFAYSNNADRQIDSWRVQNAIRSARWSYYAVVTQPGGYSDIQNLNLAIENGINYHVFTEVEIQNLLRIMSPLEIGLKTQWLHSNYAADKILVRGLIGYGIEFNGLYQELAYMYAALGNSEKALQCVDSLIQYGRPYYEGDYSTCADNAANIASVYFTNNKIEQLDSFIKGYCARKKISYEEFYAHLLGRMLPSVTKTSNVNLFWWAKAKNNLNLKFCDKKEVRFFYKRYRQSIESTISNPDEKNLLFAISYKNEGIQESMLPGDSENGIESPSKLFDTAMVYYVSVGNSYLEHSTHITSSGGGDEKVVPEKYLFLYPDLKVSFNPDEPRTFFYYAYTDIFFEYLMAHSLFNKLYPDPQELGIISDWFKEYNAKNFAGYALYVKPIRYQILQGLDKYMSKVPSSENIDLNLEYLYTGYQAQLAGDSSAVFQYYSKIQIKNFSNILQEGEFAGQIEDQSLRMIGYAVAGLYKYRHFDLANEFVWFFKNPINRASLYSFAALVLQNRHEVSNVIKVLLDSARGQIKLVKSVSQGQPDKTLLAAALILYSPSSDLEEALTVIKNIPEKADARREMCKAFGFSRELFKATENISPLISGTDLAFYDWYIINGFTSSIKDDQREWTTYSNNYYSRNISFIRYINENN